MKKKVSRREVIQSFLISPLGLYLSSKMAGLSFIANTLSQDLLNESLLENKLINFSFAGGIPRYFWDLPLRPNGQGDYLEFSKSCITKYGQNTTGDGRYEITKVGDYYFPSIWENKIATVGGSTSMKNLSPNMFGIRGLWLPQSGHSFCRKTMMIPTPGVSLLGIVADDSKLPIPCVGTGSDSSLFESSKGYGMTMANGNNALANALRPFSDGSSNWSVSKIDIENGIDAALNIMSQQSENKHKFLPSTYKTRLNAKKLMKKEFGNLSDAFKDLNSKYQSLITRSMHGGDFRVSGVEDRAIVGDGSISFNVGQPSGASSKIRYNGSDLREIFTEESNVRDLSQRFAVAEFMLTEGYTSSFSSSVGRVDKVQFNNFVDEDGKGHSNFLGSLGFDNHEMGSHVSLLNYTKVFKAFSSCMYEFIEKLKNKGNGTVSIFDRSVISVTGDFNRSARFDGSGSDHGGDGVQYTIFSGMIPKLTVIGNTTQYDSETNKWRGSWGVAAPLGELSGRKINIGNVASSICTMLDKDSPTPNDASLVKKENGKIYPLVDRPKNIS